MNYVGMDCAYRRAAWCALREAGEIEGEALTSAVPRGANVLFPFFAATRCCDSPSRSHVLGPLRSASRSPSSCPTGWGLSGDRGRGRNQT